MLADTTGNHPLPTGAKSSSFAEAFPAIYRHDQFIHIAKPTGAYLALHIRNSVRGERKFIQRNLCFLEVPQEAKFTF